MKSTSQFFETNKKSNTQLLNTTAGACEQVLSAAKIAAVRFIEELGPVLSSTIIGFAAQQKLSPHEEVATSCVSVLTKVKDVHPELPEAIGKGMAHELTHQIQNLEGGFLKFGETVTNFLLSDAERAANEAVKDYFSQPQNTASLRS